MVIKMKRQERPLNIATTHTDFPMHKISHTINLERRTTYRTLPSITTVHANQQGCCQYQASLFQVCTSHHFSVFKNSSDNRPDGVPLVAPDCPLHRAAPYLSYHPRFPNRAASKAVCFVVADKFVFVRIPLQWAVEPIGDATENGVNRRMTPDCHVALGTFS